MVIDAILLSAGFGKRFSSSENLGALPKQFQILGSLPVFLHSLRALLSLECIRQIIVAIPKEYEKLAVDQLGSFLESKSVIPVRLVCGGLKRQDSSRLALEAIEESPPTRVVIHDASRPYLSRSLITRVRDRLLDRSYGAWVPIVPIVDTLKKVANKQVVETVSREKVYRVQTPQVFEYTVIRSLIDRAKDLTQAEFTDDASLCEYYGIPVGTFEGDLQNIKLTYEFELEVLRQMVESAEKPCEPELGTTSTV